MLLAVIATLVLQDAAEPFPPVPPYTISDANAGGRPADPALFADFGGKPGVDRIVAELVARNVADPRISDIFKASDLVRLRRTLGEQFCYLLGGGCAYTGRDMKSAHTDMGLQTADMTALVQNLQAAMDREGVPFGAQNRLLAKLASMKRVVVER